MNKSMTIVAELPGTGRPVYDPLVPTVFHESWWLKAMANDQYDEAVVYSGGKMVGRFPYIVRQRPGGRTSCEMPALTHFLGPAIDEGSGTACNRSLKHAGILKELLQGMPRTGGFRHRMHRGIQDTMAFQESGYSTSVDFTFEIHPAEEALLWKNMRDKTRNMIRRAREKFEVVPISDPELFAQLYQQNIQARGNAFYYDRRDIVRLCQETMLRDQGRIIAARTADGAIAAAIFHVWDARSAYYLLSTRVGDSDNSAVSLLLWDAICHAAERNLIFDFDGVASHGSRVFFTGFGGDIRPRYVVTRDTLYYRISDAVAKSCKSLLRR
jgi:hypothetical protein